MPKNNGIYKEIIINESLKNKIIYKFNLIKKNTIIEDYLNTQIAILFIKLEFYDKTIVKNINNLIYTFIIK